MMMTIVGWTQATAGECRVSCGEPADACDAEAMPTDDSRVCGDCGCVESTGCDDGDDDDDEGRVETDSKAAWS
eukprot:2834030-Rhodomonas_salina.1